MPSLAYSGFIRRRPCRSRYPLCMGHRTAEFPRQSPVSSPPPPSTPRRSPSHNGMDDGIALGSSDTNATDAQAFSASADPRVEQRRLAPQAPGQLMGSTEGFPLDRERPLDTLLLSPASPHNPLLPTHSAAFQVQPPVQSALCNSDSNAIAPHAVSIPPLVPDTTFSTIRASAKHRVPSRTSRALQGIDTFRSETIVTQEREMRMSDYDSRIKVCVKGIITAAHLRAKGVLTPLKLGGALCSSTVALIYRCQF